MLKYAIFIGLITGSVALCGKIVPIDKTGFIEIKDNKEKYINMKNKEFIVVSVREPGSDGRFYAVDADGTVWWSGIITSGKNDFATPSGIYPVLYKKRYHMSSRYPSEDGINNMDFSIFFTKEGHALHKGSIKWLSHGCIHIDPRDIEVIYRWARPNKTMIIIMRGKYPKFAKPDIKKFRLH